MLAALFALALATSSPNPAREVDCAFAGEAETWTRDALEAWDRLDASRIRSTAPAAPAMVLFDERCVYTLSPHNAGGFRVNSRRYAVEVRTHQGTVALAGGGELPARKLAFAFPGPDGPAFVMALPSIWRADTAENRDPGRLSMLVFMHEFAHTQQTMGLGRLIDGLVARGLPDDIDDDLIQKMFEADDAYRPAWEQERDAVYAAVTAVDDVTARARLREARAMMNARHARWHVGDRQILTEADEVFLTLEGSGNWASWMWLTDPAGGAMAPAEATAFVRGTGRFWSQDEGLGLMLALDRLNPTWVEGAFGGEPRTVGALLEAATVSLPPVAAAPSSVDWMASDRDWAKALRDDARALHAAIIDSHPGVHDRLNPDFRTSAEAGLAEALNRANGVTDAGGWWWAMRAYVARFDDGHVQIGLTRGSPPLPVRWPGFLTAWRGEDQVVVSLQEGEQGLPPEGARLIDCDGIPAPVLAERRVGQFWGRWALESQRALHGDRLFQNPSNPWIADPETCRFEFGTETRTYALRWRDIAADDLTARRNGLQQRSQTASGLRRMASGGVWLSMPSFNADPATAPHRVMTSLVEAVRAGQSELRAAPVIVLDLRGNGGGSSHWAREIARLIWGGAWLEAHEPSEADSVDWRASEANQLTLQGYADEWRAAGEEEGRILWAQTAADGMAAARRAGELYFVQAGDRLARSVDPELVSTVRGQVFILTDPVCASACLDAVDLWTALGAVQVGRETSADTVYMDIRGLPLPSGLGRMSIPMKVWRGRARGHNEPHSPAHRFDGDMSDNDALEAWIGSLL